MTRINRDEILSLLERLGETDDAEVLGAARHIHELVTASGSAWEDMLVPDEQVTDPSVNNIADEELISLLEQLLARADLSESTREELDGYKEDIAEGELTDDDRRYLQAFAARL
ncbi:MAG TPA: hypothetical protein EYQ81_06950 [Sneathiellales bacterium]|nr:hypothetical protein [Sneathiellales bacterium]